MISVLCCLQLTAQTSKPRPRPLAPTSFLGIQFGKPISDSVRKCDRYEASVDTCFEPISDFYKVRNIELFSNIFVNEIDGKVGNIDAEFNVDNADQILRALREKYGPPALDTITHLQNSMGAQIRGRKIYWHWAHISIVFKSPDSMIDEGTLSAYTMEYIAAIERDQKKEKDALKGVL